MTYVIKDNAYVSKSCQYCVYGIFECLYFSKVISITTITQTASCQEGLKVALNSIKSRGRRDYGARHYNSLLLDR